MISLLADKALWNWQLKEIEELISLHLRIAGDFRAEGLVLKNREAKGITRGLERVEFGVALGWHVSKTSAAQMSTSYRIFDRGTCWNCSPIKGYSGDSLILLRILSTELIGTKRWWSCLIAIKSVTFVLEGAGCNGTLSANWSWEQRIVGDTDIWIINRTWLNYALAEINAASTSPLTISVNVLKF